MLILESEEFAEVKFGGLLPWCPPPVYEVIYEDEDAVRATMEAKIEALKNVIEKAEALFKGEPHYEVELIGAEQASDLRNAIWEARVAIGDLKAYPVKKVEGGEG